ncbi:MAG: cyclic pyranopterin monophosphate synthase MoaC, partial [bacterium]
MRDITRKIDTLRTAKAQAMVRIGPDGLKHLKAGTLPKGEPFGICQAAAMLGAKKTSELIPHCHNIALDGLDVECTMVDGGVLITTVAKTVGRTGVEMEALTACSIAALTLYDLLKPVEADVAITDTRIVEMKGGSSQFARMFGEVKPNFAVLVASDRASGGAYDDTSGKKIGELLGEWGAVQKEYAVLPDEQAGLQQQLVDWTKDGSVDFIFTTGGTGIAPRDVMVEATKAVSERE